MSPYVADYFRYTWQMLNGVRTGAELDISKQRQSDIAPYLGADRSLRILDVANGRLRPQFTILRAAGHAVYGIDFVNRHRTRQIDTAYQIVRWLYTWKLGIPADLAAARTLICGDVGYLPFPDNYFDLGTSVAAFEHFLDIPAVIAELH